MVCLNVQMKIRLQHVYEVWFHALTEDQLLYHEVLAEGNSGYLMQHSYRTHKYATFTKCKASGFKNLAVLYLLLGLEGLRLFVWRIIPLWCFCHGRRCVLNGIPTHRFIVWVVQGASARIP